jgi:hypothetical protein
MTLLMENPRRDVIVLDLVKFSPTNNSIKTQ